jgi:hypothetical protein
MGFSVYLFLPDFFDALSSILARGSSAMLYDLYSCGVPVAPRFSLTLVYP